ncbi:MAG: hypothetical protein H0X41_00525 [Chitinophagaceae bacterium]|nr:hypothetical protein [Chitinophagaceae bacterium]
MKRLSVVLILVLFIAQQSFAETPGTPAIDTGITQTKPSKIYTPKVSGPWRHIYNPNDRRKPIDSMLWYTNDHSFVYGSDRQWHCYGIIGWGKFTNQQATDNDVSPWTRETNLFHISAKNLDDLIWPEHDYAMTVDKGVERVLWAPYVLKDTNKYVMFYNTGSLFANADQYASFGSLRKATSADMFHWKKYALNPLFSDPGHSRDSYVMKYNHLWYYYYCRVKNELDSTSCVAVRTSPDGDNWSGPAIAHEEPPFGHWGGNTESPFVVQYKGLFYLFICYSSDYNKTLVYWSNDPLHFPKENLVTTIAAHAVEIMQDKDRWFISNTGWDKDGLYLAKMIWE